jgi:Ran GTPase-activating protein (RanGAP) involved in mRNA processing and transport
MKYCDCVVKTEWADSVIILITYLKMNSLQPLDQVYKSQRLQKVDEEFTLFNVDAGARTSYQPC